MYRVLHRALCTATEPATVSIKSISEDLYKEVKLKSVVEKFKKASDIDRFRKKTGIYEDTVRRLARAKRFRWVRDILEHQKQYSDISNEGFSSRLISLYGKSGMAKHARKVFDEMPQRKCDRSVLSLNALLAAYLHSKKYDVVEELFRALPTQLSIEPDLVSYNTLIKAFCEKGSFDSALSVVKEMEEKGVDPDSITFNTLLDGLYSKGCFEDGEKVWGQMGAKNVAPDVRSYCSRLVGLAGEKKAAEAVELFREMEKVGVKPNIFCINAVIKGFVNEGNLDEAKKWFGEIANSDDDPHKNTYSTLVPFLCEKGDLKTAIEMCKEIFNIRCRVDASLLQLVVDKLVSEFKRAQLEASTFLKDDCLKINCTVGVVVSSIDCSKLNTIQVPESDIGSHFGMLLENEEGSDVTFSVGGERFHAHKLVLAARSTAFETEFFNGMEEDEQDIVVTDMEPKVFKALLHFIYRDTLIDDEELFVSRSSFLPSVSESFAAKLLAAAEKYDLPRLKLMCESVLCKDISIDSVAYILALADRYRATELKSVCLQFSAENLVAVMQSDGFEYLKENCPLLQSELLKTVAGCEEEFSGEGKCRSVWAQFSDGGDTNDRSVRQQTWENGVDRSQSLWVHLSDGVNNNDRSPGQEP